MYIVSTESLEYLLTCGCHADDHAGPTGATALHYAVTAAHGECVHILLNYGANVNAVVTSEEVCVCVCVLHNALLCLLQVNGQESSHYCCFDHYISVELLY